jgi:lipopolysaccharide transport system ATP-binding protein
MSEALVISARDLRKVYRLYAKPHYRVLDVMGLLRPGGGRYTEHAALDGVSLDVRRGEKVALIGRNGAGKSTLLKILSRVIEPTAGTLSVEGQVHALLQIGTGFHPDFSGRENVYAYLAQLGVSGRQADDRYREIVEFAELEEYISQPLKTYSTGMSVRLMFSAATAISPDILVLDEVLGVGDAYFSHKSYERIRALADAHGTTLLLVTHDLYSAAKLCERIVWIDNGRVLMDGPGTLVIKAYEDSVRAQEERRLRRRKLAALDAARERDAASVDVLIELQVPPDRPLQAPVYFSRLALYAGDLLVDVLPLGHDAFAARGDSHLIRETSNWGEPEHRDGREARALLDYGTPYHKAGGVFVVGDGAVLTRAENAVEFEYLTQGPVALEARLFVHGKMVDLGPLPASSGGWQQHRAAWRWDLAESATTDLRINPTGLHGTHAITLSEIRVLNESGHEVQHVEHGTRAEIVMPFEIRRPGLCERAQVLLAFQRDGVTDVCRYLTREMVFDGASAPTGVIRLRIPRMGLGPGTYALSVMLAEPGYYDQDQVLFYSINPGVYTCLSRTIEIVVYGGGMAAAGTGVVLEGDWSLEPGVEGAAREERPPEGSR